MNRNAQRGLRIRSERKRLEMTQAEAASAVGVSREMFSRYESGATPGDGVLEAMAKAGFNLGYITEVPVTYAIHKDAFAVNARESSAEVCGSDEGLSWRDVLEIVLNELQRAGLALPGDKVIRLTDLLMEYQKLGVSVDQDFVGKQIRLVA